MLTAKIALIDQTNKIPFAQLNHIASALATQVSRDLSKHWPVSATVTAHLAAAKVPIDTWPIYIVDNLPAGEGGYHWENTHNQPYAVVLNGPNWTTAASHEMIEMLIDPWGNRLTTARVMTVNGNTVGLGTAKVHYLVEACDPPEAEGYEIDGVAVSDFVYPQYYITGTKPGRYSFTGAITTPLEMLFGGYISWIDPATDEWMQLTWLDKSKPPSIQNLGKATGFASLKEFVDSKSGGSKRVAQDDKHPAYVMAQAVNAKP